MLPNKKKSRVKEPYEIFRNKSQMFIEDIREIKTEGYKNKSAVNMFDAREPGETDKVDLVLTSPPYPNNYDYADATRLEMTFWGEISGWSDLQPVVRKYLLRSCSQHSAAEKLSLDELLSDPLLAPIHEEIRPVCEKMGEIRLTKGGRKTYHTMIAAYFLDLAKIWVNLRKVCRKNSEVCFVIGDSAPYGVYVPADEWLGELAVSAGFKNPSFEKIRDRNIKWKNRKHRVPLKEGRLWLDG